MAYSRCGVARDVFVTGMEKKHGKKFCFLVKDEASEKTEHVFIKE